MDALILSCGTGGGHNAAGSAIAEELIRRGSRVTMLNPYTLLSEHLAEGINNLYIGIAQKTPAVFGAIYNAGSYTGICPSVHLFILSIAPWFPPWKNTWPETALI